MGWGWGSWHIMQLLGQNTYPTSQLLGAMAAQQWASTMSKLT
jgi:hypothetical protein